MIIPLDNKADLKEIPDVITDKLEIIPVEWIDEVILHSLESQPKAINKSSSFKSKSKNRQKLSASTNPQLLKNPLNTFWGF